MPVFVIAGTPDEEVLAVTMVIIGAFTKRFPHLTVTTGQPGDEGEANVFISNAKGVVGMLTVCTNKLVLVALNDRELHAAWPELKDECIPRGWNWENPSTDKADQKPRWLVYLAYGLPVLVLIVAIWDLTR